MELKRSILYKIPKLHPVFVKLFDSWGDVKVHVQNYIQSVNNEHENLDKLQHAKILDNAVCSKCTTKYTPKKLTKRSSLSNWYRYKDGSLFCTSCFKNKWDRVQLTKKEFIQPIQQQFPGMAAKQVYYSSAIKDAIASYSSYITKIKENLDKVQKLKQAIEIEKSEQTKEKFKARLKRAEIGIKPLGFKKNMVLFNEGMVNFRKHNEKYQVKFSHPFKSTKEGTIWHDIAVSTPKEYTFNTVHNKIEFLNEIIKTKNKKFMAELLKRVQPDGSVWYEVSIPHRDNCDATDISLSKKLITTLTNRIEKLKTDQNYLPKLQDTKRKDYLDENTQELNEHLTHTRKAAELPLVTLNWGIDAITIMVWKQKRLICTHQFKTKHIFQKIIYAKIKADKVKQRIAQRYKDKHERYIRIRKMKQRTSKKLLNYIKYSSHNLMTKITNGIKNNIGACVIGYRDLKGAKGLAYGEPHNKILQTWNIEAQKVFLSYKSHLRDLYTLPIPYGQISHLECPHCHSEILVEGSPVSILTQTLKQAGDGRIHLEIQRNRHQRAINHLVILVGKKKNSEHVREKIYKWIQSTKRKYTLADKMLKEYMAQRPLTHIFCQSCNKRDMYFFANHVQLRDTMLKTLQEATSDKVQEASLTPAGNDGGATSST